MGSPIDAITLHFVTPESDGGLGLGWGDMVWHNRMMGKGVVSALGQPIDVLTAQTVLSPFAQQRAPVGERWTQYGVEVARYSFDYEQAKANAEEIMLAYDVWKGNTSCTPRFSIPGWQGRLFRVENLEVIGAVNTDGDPRLWKAVVQLYFVNLEAA